MFKIEKYNVYEEKNKYQQHSCLFIVEENIHGARISGKENCLVHNSIIGFEAINCFYDTLGYMCENRGTNTSNWVNDSNISEM